jgi:predicted O-methyltransferase YrrM
LALFWKVFWRLPGSGRLLQDFVVKPFVVDSASLSNTDEAWDFAHSFHRLGVSIIPAQVRGEFLALCDLVRGIEPRIIVEIGTDLGGTLFVLTRAASSDAVIISVDLPRWHLKSRSALFEAFAHDEQRILVVRGDSHSAAIVDKVAKSLDGREIDLLFIDGDHSYEGVKTDFKTYMRFVKNGGMIAFHDINPDNYSKFGGGEPKGGEVYRFWDETKRRFRHIEFIETPGQDGFGIGILWMQRYP